MGYFWGFHHFHLQKHCQIINKMLQVAEGSTLGQRVYTWLFSTFFIPSNKKSIYRANAAHFGMFCALTDSKISGA